MPQAGGAFSGLMKGLVKGFGGTMLEIENQKHDDAIRDKQTRIRILESAVDNDNLDDDSRQAALDQMGEIIDGKPGGKTSEKLKELLGPILAVGKLMGGVKGQPQTSAPNEPTPAIPSAPRPNGSVSPPELSAPAEPAVVAQGGIPAAPKRMMIKTKAQKQQEILDTDKARIIQEFALKDVEKAKQLANAPAEVDAKIDSNIKIARKHYRVIDKENPKGRPLRDDESLPESYSQAIIEDAMGLTQQRAGVIPKPQKLSEVDKAPEGAVDIEGKPVSTTGPFNVYLQPDGTKAYEPLNRKALAGNVEFDRKVEAAIASGIPAATARTYVLQQGFKSEREKLAGLIERNTGTKLTNQMRQDFISGKVTPAIARGLMGVIQSQARTVVLENRAGDTPPESPYYGKTQAEIEDMKLMEAGHDRAELMDAIGGKTSTPTVPAAPRPPGSKSGNPLGLPGL